MDGNLLGFNLEDLKALTGMAIPLMVMALVEAFKSVPRFGEVKALYLPLAMVLGSLAVTLLHPEIAIRDGISLGVIVGFIAGGAQGQISAALKGRITTSNNNVSSSPPPTP